MFLLPFYLDVASLQVLANEVLERVICTTSKAELQKSAMLFCAYFFHQLDIDFSGSALETS